MENQENNIQQDEKEKKTDEQKRQEKLDKLTKQKADINLKRQKLAEQLKKLEELDKINDEKIINIDVKKETKRERNSKLIRFAAAIESEIKKEIDVIKDIKNNNDNDNEKEIKRTFDFDILLKIILKSKNRLATRYLEDLKNYYSDEEVQKRKDMKKQEKENRMLEARQKAEILVAEMLNNNIQNNNDTNNKVDTEEDIDEGVEGSENW